MSKAQELAAKGYEDGKRDARNDQYIQRPQYRTSKNYRDAYGQAHTDAALGKHALHTYHSDALGAVTIPEDDDNRPYHGTAPIERGPFPGMIWP